MCSLYNKSHCQELKQFKCVMEGEPHSSLSPLVLVVNSPINFMRHSQGSSTNNMGASPCPYFRSSFFSSLFALSPLPSPSPSPSSLSPLFLLLLLLPRPLHSLPSSFSPPFFPPFFFLLLPTSFSSLLSLFLPPLPFSSSFLPLPLLFSPPSPLLPLPSSLSPLPLYHRTAYPNMFEVHTRDRIFLLSAPTDEEMQSWVGMLQTLKQYDKQRHFTRRNCPTSLQNSPLRPPSDRQSPTRRRRVASDTDSERKSAQAKEDSMEEAEKEEMAKGVLNGRRKSGFRTKHGSFCVGKEG